MKFIPLLAAMIILLGGAACGAPSAPTQVVPATAEALELPTGVETAPPTAAPVLPLETTPTAVEIPPGSEALIARAIEDLVQGQALASADEVRLVSVEAREWPDTSLGCPKEGFMYAQVITPGFQILLEAGGQQYDYHTDLNQTVVLCELNPSQ